jgi:hypothetical protein
MFTMHAELPYREVHTVSTVESTEPEHRPVVEETVPSSKGQHPMAKRLVPIIVILLVLGLAYVVYQRWVTARNASNNGVQLLGDPDSNNKVVVDKSELNDLRDKADNAIRPATTTTTTQTTTPANTFVVPASDSIPANPPNDTRFSGTGRYQLYRQGSITWRLDTDSGHTCIIFATDEQWHLQRVYSHGCANE